MIVDASGQSTLIMGKLGLREWDPLLKKAACWTYWEGAQRDVGRDEGATIVLQVQGKAGWFWYIPLHDNIVSVGIVASHDYLFKNRDTKDFETIYHEEVEKCPAVKQRISIGKRADIYRAAKEYSYRSQRCSGDGWVLVGDALGFLDPLYSSGVLLALKSGQLAADAVCEGLAKGDTSGRQLGGWEADYFRGMERMRSLVCAYYAGFSFGRFVAKHPQRKGDITDLLIGDLFRPELDETLGLIRRSASELHRWQNRAECGPSCDCLAVVGQAVLFALRSVSRHFEDIACPRTAKQWHNLDVFGQAVLFDRWQTFEDTAWPKRARQWHDFDSIARNCFTVLKKSLRESLRRAVTFKYGINCGGSSPLPLVEELASSNAVMMAVQALAHWPNLLLLDSTALGRQPVGRYSFLMADPVARWTLPVAPFGSVRSSTSTPRMGTLAGRSI